MWVGAAGLIWPHCGPLGKRLLLWDPASQPRALPAALETPLDLPQKVFSASSFCTNGAWGWTAGRVGRGQEQGMGGSALGPGGTEGGTEPGE